MATKFILIDPSITSVGGHHCEYALHVLRAAKSAGFEIHLAANLRYRDGAPDGVTVHPVYHRGFWSSDPSGGILFQLGAAWERLRVRFLCRVRFSALGVAWTFRRRFGDFLHNQPADRRYVSTLPQLVFFAFTIKLLRFVLLVIGLLPAAFVWIARNIIRLLGRSPAVRRYAGLLVEEFTGFYQYLRRWWHERRNTSVWFARMRSQRRFHTDTKRLFSHIALNEGDVVFVPTISDVELLGLAKFLARTPESKRAGWHLLFRRNIYNGREGDYGSQEYSVSGLWSTFQAVRVKLPDHRLAFYTDTEELSEQYNRLGAFSFRTLPIPHTHEPIEREAGRAPLQAIYLGDARTEKGYHRIPGLIQDIWADFVDTGRIEFTLQSNYNLPGGEPAAVIARAQLEQFPVSRVQLSKRPLSSSEYSDLLLHGDLNLLLYDRDNYYARSSGVLVEALSVGMPVVVPAGTWLARQFLRQTYAHQESWREKLDIAESLRDGEVEWKRPAGRTPETRLRVTLAVPPDSEWLLVSLEVGGSGKEITLLVQPIDEGRFTVDQPAEYLLETAAGRAVCLYRIPGAAAKLRLDVRPATPNGLLWLTNTRLDFLSRRRDRIMPAVGSVGAVYHSPDQISDAVRDLLRNFEHYRQTALTFAGPWRAYHNAGNLVRQLTGCGERDETEAALVKEAHAGSANGSFLVARKQMQTQQGTV